jgi:uncharacterized membrane protein YfcA
MMPIYTLVFLGGSILIAGIIRGYSGFGFSMVAVICLSLVFSPKEAVPLILLMEIVASASLLPRVWRQVDWHSLLWLSVGVVFGTPAGVYLLANIPARPMRAAIAITVMALVVLLWRGFALKTMPSRGQTVATGVASGLLNGAATIGGPPVILFYFSTPAGVAVSRASLIAFFLGTDILAFVICLTQGLVNTKTGVMLGACLIPLLIGIRLGSHFFNKSNEESFRRKVLILLMILSMVAFIRALWVT